mmetsp:Transcript_70303/g.165490  ORF Transcript_70303/g.165490 Transcript_70303/m.165490 type:complete len:261 (-) Transcript_70303:19-801(-)
MGRGSGKGGSSDVYYYHIVKVDQENRVVEFIITPTMAGSVALGPPMDRSWSSFFTMLLWEQVNPIEIDLGRPRATYTINGMDLSEWFNSLAPEVKSDGLACTRLWEALPEEEKRPYLERHNADLEEINRLKVERVFGDPEASTLSLLSVDDICSSRVSELSWRYIENVEELSREGFEEDEEGFDDHDPRTHVTAHVRVTVTEPKVLNGVRVKGRDGTTAWNQGDSPAPSEEDVALYFAPARRGAGDHLTKAATGPAAQLQ